MTSPGVGASAGFLGNGAGSRQLRVRWRSHLVTSSVALTRASIDGSGGGGLKDKMHVYMMTLMGRVEKVAAVASSGGSPQQVSW